MPTAPTRRQLIQWLAATPALLRAQNQAPPTVPELPRKGPEQHVLILGGGLAGLCCAFELQRQGHRATVLEAQLRPGGRVHTIRDRMAPGVYVEAGAEAIPSAHNITQHYARTLGLTLLSNAVANARS